jgi:DNA polymerase-3 subunit gamma/tau
MLEVAKLMDARSLSFDGGLQELATLVFHRIALAQFAPKRCSMTRSAAASLPYAQALDAEYLQLAYQIAVHGRDELWSGAGRIRRFRHDAAAAACLRSGTRRLQSCRRQDPLPSIDACANRRLCASRRAGSAVPGRGSRRPTAPTACVGGKAIRCRLHVRRRLACPGGAAIAARHGAPACPELRACRAGGDASVRLRLTPAAQAPAGQGAPGQAAGGAARTLGVAALARHRPWPNRRGDTRGERRQNSERERQEKAIAAIEQDPFVRDVVDLFDASIDQSTIKPV